MKDLRTFLLSCKGFSDGAGNTVVFSDRGLAGEPNGEEFWMFMDEGLRCGGMHRKIEATEESMKEALLGCKKDALWEAIEKAIKEAIDKE
jgi:hypothetical protein